MSTDDRNPDGDTLERYLLGRLDDAEHDRVERHLLHSDQCLAQLQDLNAQDALMAGLRGLDIAALPAETPVVQDLVRRLEQLRPEGEPATTDTPCSLASEPSGATPAGGLILAAPQQPDELGRLGGYRVLRLLGTGGMGMVFEAEDPVLKRRVALKVMQPDVALRPASRQRFLREAQLAAALEHEHVVAIHQVGEERGVLFLAMPLLAGEALEDRLQREQRLPVAEAVRIGRQVAEGLAAAHAVGLIHRDIKPANIFLKTAGERRKEEQDQSSVVSALHPSPAAFTVKILDFGLARPIDTDVRLTQSGLVMGTPGYLAPEQANGEAVDGRADLFSLGCVLYRMTTGEAPFRGANITALLRAVAEHQPPPPQTLRPEIPAALSALILRLLAKVPGDRPASAREVAEALRTFEETPPRTLPAALPTSATYVPAGSWPARRWRWVAAAAVVFLVVGLLVGGQFLWRLATGSRDSGAPAEPSPETVKYQGYINAEVWAKAGEQVTRMHLTDPGALPLRVKDQIRAEAEVTPAAYLYLFWIDTEGKADPVYPWEPGKWGTRPAEEQPRSHLELPKQLTKGWTITGAKEGMETLILLARPTPWELSDDAIQQLLAGLPVQRPVQDPRSAVWFENGAVVKQDARRQRAHFVEENINDPVLHLQELLREKLQPHGTFTTAVSFARQGK
jgi:serine/threonine protein kinase